MKFLSAAICLLLCSTVAANDYYVSPVGSDANDGLTPATAWASLSKVSATPFQPGDSILLERGGVWRERLDASSSGTYEQPITYGAYGAGAKPRIYGSDVLNKTAPTLSPGRANTYELPFANVGSVLANGNFLHNAWLQNGQSSNQALLLDYVENTPNSYYYANGKIYLNPGSDLSADPRQFTLVTRDALVNSNAKNHIVFRDLVADESAFYNGGYGIAALNSLDVKVLDCEAYRAGKHNFVEINTHEFLGKGIKAAYAMPDQGSGGSTALVSFSDQFHLNQSSAWEDVEVWDLGGPYLAWYSHGEGLGDVKLKNFRTTNYNMTIGNFTHAEDLFLENTGVVVTEATADRIYMTGPNTSVVFGSNATVTNVLIENFYRTGGFASPVVAIGEGNKLQFATINVAPQGQVDSLFIFPGFFQNPRTTGQLEVLGVVVNNQQNPSRIISMIHPTPEELDAAFDGDYNLYHNASFHFWYDDAAITFEQWQDFTHADEHTLLAAPLYQDAAQGDYRLTAGSPGVGLVPAGMLEGYARYDYAGRPRFLSEFVDVGAFADPSASADFNVDGAVDGADFLVWQRNAGRTVARFEDGDANFDGAVDAADLAHWANAAGSARAAPEPSLCAMGLSLVLSALHLRRRSHQF